MSAKILCLVFLLIAYTRAQADCSCETTQDKEARNLLDTLLEKLSNHDEDKKVQHYVYPGQLEDYNCNCEKKNKRKRKNAPALNEVEPIPEEPREREKKYIHDKDRSCPLGSVRYLDACLPEEDFEEY